MTSLDDIIYRQPLVENMLHALSGDACVSLVGLNNTGKSMLLRAIGSPEFARRYRLEAGREGAFVFVDCNRMVELSGQGFYELVLRSVQESVRLEPELAQRITVFYRQVVETDSHFQISLNFNNAMTALIEDSQRDVVLLLDEFDEAFEMLDGRVFLNLRALHDRYPRSLLYVTATIRRLGYKRSDEQSAEFIELSAAHTYVLQPLPRSGADDLMVTLAREANLQVSLTQEILDFAWAQAGGHPGLLGAVINRLAAMEDTSQPIDPRSLQAALAHDVAIRTECNRLWGQLNPEERETLLAAAVGTLDHGGPRSTQSLLEWGMLREEDGRVTVFSDLMGDFVRHQATVQRDLPGGVWVDEDAGDVWIGGARIDALTDLEYKLLALLYRRANKLTDKYEIVENVWGTEYIDEVDDARIEKLISRVRAKIEPDPANPRYLLTVRGRGYKLNSTV
jgi:hypothetical protein